MIDTTDDMPTITLDCGCIAYIEDEWGIPQGGYIVTECAKHDPWIEPGT